MLDCIFPENDTCKTLVVELCRRFKITTFLLLFSICRFRFNIIDIDWLFLQEDLSQLLHQDDMIELMEVFDMADIDSGGLLIYNGHNYGLVRTQ